MSLGTYLAVFAVMIVGATVQSAAGFGQGLVGAPALRLLHPPLLPAPIVLAGLLVAFGVAKRNSRRSDLPAVVPALGGRVVGNLIALALLAWLSERGLSVAIGIIVLAFVGARLAGVTVPRTRNTLGGAGVVSGIGGTIAALGGAPMALLYEQHSAARAFRGPMGAYTAIGGVLSVLTLIVAGRIDGEALLLTLSLLPPVAIGWVLGGRLSPILDRGYLRPLVMGVSSLSAVALILGELL